MPLELSSDRAVCTRCGTEYSRRKGYFPVSYAILYKGICYIPVCKTCIDSMYNTYLSQCNDSKDAVRQMCRKLDLYWSDSVYEIVARKSTTRSMMTQYIAKINTVTYAGKSYDDTLSSEGTLWVFSPDIHHTVDDAEPAASVVVEPEGPPAEEISEDVKAFWGAGYTSSMYIELEQRRSYWMARFPQDMELDVGTEALIRQICSLELDINRDRAAGRSVEKSVTALNQLLGSANLKPVQKKQDDVDAALASTPLGVWLYRYENKRPLPEIDDDLKDVNGIRKYVFTWMGHLCKMLGIKNAYSQMYEGEIARLRVDRPEYDGDDDEMFMSELMSTSPQVSEENDTDEADAI